MNGISRRRTSAALVCATLAGCTLAGVAPLGAQIAEPGKHLPAIRDASTLKRTAALGTLEDELVRILEITDTAAGDERLLRRLSAPMTPVSGLAVGTVPARVVLVGNSGYAAGGNDGRLWAGRGVSALLAAGARSRWGPFSAALAPELALQQNAEFEIRRRSRPGYSPYSDPFNAAIDLPQRFGAERFMSAGLGQSHVRLDVGGFAGGVSTENLWWGPAMRYPLLMSNNGPGFPHVFAGTGRPVDVWIGNLEAELIWGRLRESAYFDENPENDDTGLVALVASFSPRVLPGLSVGFARVYQYRDTDGGWLRDPRPVLEVVGGSGVNRPGNELFSVFGRWAFPESGAELYGEWGRDDRWFDWKELVQEPDHSQAYMLGFQKITPLSEATDVRIHLEMVALQELGELRGGSRPLPVWYTHSRIRQGYTHRGQLLGAWIGPGADAQFLGVDALLRGGMAGLFLERVRRNDATGAALDGRRFWPREHDTELIFGLRGLYPATRALTLEGRASFGYRFNRNFLSDDNNFGLDLRGTWLPAVTFGR